MARSQSNESSELRRQAIDLLKNFEVELQKGDLRAKVKTLVPVFRTLRDLGASLISVEDGQSGRDRILAYLVRYAQLVISGEELMVVAGIDDWGRRVRELRQNFGWSILTGETVKDMVRDATYAGEAHGLQSADGVDLAAMKVTDYMLATKVRDREAADRWNVANTIRRKGIAVKSKILEFLLLNVGRSVTNEELRYLAKDKSEWARRIRELRTQDGWSVMTKTTGRPDLPIGAYILASDKQAEPHDRKIKDDVRAEVLARDKYTCQYSRCGWNQTKWNPALPRHLELHHQVHHAKKGSNEADNLITYCNLHHDKIHREEGRAATGRAERR